MIVMKGVFFVVFFSPLSLLLFQPVDLLISGVNQIQQKSRDNVFDFEESRLWGCKNLSSEFQKWEPRA